MKTILLINTLLFCAVGYITHQLTPIKYFILIPFITGLAVIAIHTVLFLTLKLFRK